MCIAWIYELIFTLYLWPFIYSTIAGKTQKHLSCLEDHVLVPHANVVILKFCADTKHGIGQLSLAITRYSIWTAFISISLTI